MLAVLIALAAGIGVALSTHAVARHGSDARAIRKCIEQNGPQQVWRDREDNFFKLCQLPDGRFGVQIVKRAAENGAKWVEKTAYVKGNGSWQTVARWLDRMGATPYHGPIP
jgi:putative hemolysin